MNRRTFLSGLLALPFARGSGKLPLPHQRWLLNTVPLPFGRTNDIIATTTIETRSQDIADNVYADNALLRMVDRDWQRSSPYAVGDEVALGNRVLVCVVAGDARLKDIEAAGPFTLRLTGIVGEPALHSRYHAGTASFDEDHTRTLIRRMRREARWRYHRSLPAWPFGNGLA